METRINLGEPFLDNELGDDQIETKQAVLHQPAQVAWWVLQACGPADNRWVEAGTGIKLWWAVVLLCVSWTCVVDIVWTVVDLCGASTDKSASKVSQILVSTAGDVVTVAILWKLWHIPAFVAQKTAPEIRWLDRCFIGFQMLVFVFQACLWHNFDCSTSGAKSSCLLHPNGSWASSLLVAFYFTVGEWLPTTVYLAALAKFALIYQRRIEAVTSLTEIDEMCHALVPLLHDMKQGTRMLGGSLMALCYLSTLSYVSVYLFAGDHHWYSVVNSVLVGAQVLFPLFFVGCSNQLIKSAQRRMLASTSVAGNFSNSFIRCSTSMQLGADGLRILGFRLDWRRFRLLLLLAILNTVKIWIVVSK